MAAVLIPNGKQAYVTPAGVPAVGYKVATFAAGTNNPQTTWADALKVAANPNPVILDARGEAAIFWDGAYKVQFQDPTGVPVWTVDNVNSSPAPGSSQIPSTDNAFDLGSAAFSWRNLYLGANHTPVLDTTTGNIGSIARTAAEIAAAVTPTSYAYPPLNPYRYGADGSGGAADTTAMTAVNNVLAQITGLNWFKNDLRSLPNDVRRYGAVGDGVTDDSAAFTRALTQWSGKAIIVPTPPVAYKITAAGLTVPANTAVIGDNKRTCKFLAGGNIDVFTLNDGAQLYRLYVEGNATTGHGVVFPSGAGNQTIMNCRVINFDVGTGGGCLHFADNTAGSRLSVHDLETWQTNGQSGNNKFAVYVPDVFIATAVPRKFAQVETSGFCSFFLGGCNDFFIGESFLADLSYSANSRAVELSGSCRVANQVALVIKGANHCFAANDVNPQVIIDSSLTNSVIGPMSINSGTTAFYSISGITQAVSAVVTLSTVSGTNPIKVGNYVMFDNVAGMTQINGLNGLVSAIGGVSGAWTVTVGINSSAFTAYSSGGNLSAPGIVDNSPGNNSVQVFWQRQLYNPMLASGGTAPVLGNGTLAGYFSRQGSATFVVINFTVGSTTTLGSGDIRFTLPVSKQDGEVISGGSVVINHSGTIYTAQTQIPGNVNYVTMLRDTSGSVTFNSPIVFAAGDTIRLSFTYEP